MTDAMDNRALGSGRYRPASPLGVLPIAVGRAIQTYDARRQSWLDMLTRHEAEGPVLVEHMGRAGCLMATPNREDASLDVFLWRPTLRGASADTPEEAEHIKEVLAESRELLGGPEEIEFTRAQFYEARQDAPADSEGEPWEPLLEIRRAASADGSRVVELRPHGDDSKVNRFPEGSFVNFYETGRDIMVTSVWGPLVVSRIRPEPL